MKVIVTLCFAFAFTQVVVGGRVRYGHRTIRQSSENADAGQLQQPPVANQPEIPADTPSSLSSVNVDSKHLLEKYLEAIKNPGRIPNFNEPKLENDIKITVKNSNNKKAPGLDEISNKKKEAAAAQNAQPSETISSPNSLEINQFPTSSLTPSQIPPNSTAVTSSTPEFTSPPSIQAQIPSPKQPPPSSTPSLPPCNPTTPSCGNLAEFADSSNIQVQVPSHNPAMDFGRSAGQALSHDPAMTSDKSAGCPLTRCANPMINPNLQQFYYNPYYPPYPSPMAYTNSQMMYGMPSPYLPMQYMPPFAQPPLMNYSQPPYIGNFTSPPSLLPHPNSYPPDQVPAPSTKEDSAIPRIMSSMGESGTDIESLPPQVKEFIDMIPQILSMHESSPDSNYRESKHPSLRKLLKMSPSSSLKKKQYYNSNYLSSAYSDYPQRHGYYY